MTRSLGSIPEHKVGGHTKWGANPLQFTITHYSHTTDNLDLPTVHVFGLGREIQYTPQSLGRTYILHIHRAKAGIEPPTPGVFQ